MEILTVFLILGILAYTTSLNKSINLLQKKLKEIEDSLYIYDNCTSIKWEARKFINVWYKLLEYLKIELVEKTTESHFERKDNKKQ